MRQRFLDTLRQREQGEHLPGVSHRRSLPSESPRNSLTGGSCRPLPVHSPVSGAIYEHFDSAKLGRQSSTSSATDLADACCRCCPVGVATGSTSQSNHDSELQISCGSCP